MATHTSVQPIAIASATTNVSANARPSLDLHIHGKGMMLSGTFGGWQSRLVLGPDLDDVGVSLFVDATSVGGAAETADKMFTFHSRTVEARGKGRYHVVGDFTGAEATRELELDVESPLGHTPLIALTFNAERKDFGAHWDSLAENATLFGKADEEQTVHLEAAGWITVPQVAAA